MGKLAKFRSVPDVIPANRSYVISPDIPEYQISNHNYSGFFAYLVSSETDAILLEWDIAIDRPNLDRFTFYCNEEPDIIHVAPYQVLSGNVPAWVHTRHNWHWVDTDEPYCAHFGFGCIYLPWPRIAGWKPNPIDPRLTDTNFSTWYYGVYGLTPIHWDINVVHLNV